MAETARVAPLAPVEGTFTYRVPAHLDGEAVPGARVVVPFGARMLTGVVVARTAEAREGLREVLDVLDEEPAFPGTLLRLTRWVADYYACAWGEVLKAALPAGTTVESRCVVRRTGDTAALPEALREALAQGPVPLEALLGDGVTHHLVRRLAREGLLAVEQVLGEAEVRVRTVPHLRLTPEGATAQPRGARQRAVLEALTRRHAQGEADVPQAALLAETGATASTVRALVGKGWVERRQREVVRTPFDEPPAPPPAHVLHAAQHAALDAVAEALGARRPRTFLLHGVTGSGKTEVYIRALQQTLDQGRTGIVLVPEIALTPQTVRRFRAHFGDRVAVLHSRMGPGERFDAWRLLRRGRFDVVIGPRSAVFAPLRDVGLVVVDEEHEPSYKQFDPAPRYHARDVAVLRAHLEGAVCVLGSATPSLESWRNAQTGKYTLLPMPARVPVPGREAAPLPEVRVVDLGWERKVRRLRGALAHPLREAIAQRLERGEGVILLQNRRGYSPVVTCPACGFTPRCRHCAVTLTYHQAQRHLRCHYCGRVERLPARCPSCTSEEPFERVGVGTQRVEEELRAVFPGVRVLRMDLDTTGRKDAHRRLLDAFGRGEADVLLGTQMVAKGLDFPRVTLVGVVDADTGLLLPDFRAAERTFQLLMQVAGRAGRGGLPGEVFLQTRCPDHPALRFAAAHDVEAFVREELAERRALGYPPFGRMAGVEFKGRDEAETARVAAGWTEALQRVAGPVEVLGPQPAFIGRIKGLYRFHTLLKAAEGTSGAALARLVREASARFGPPPKGVRVLPDIDPVGLL